MKINNLPDKQLKVMDVKMVSEFGRRVKLSENFNKEIENTKTNEAEEYNN